MRNRVQFRSCYCTIVEMKNEEKDILLLMVQDENEMLDSDNFMLLR